MTDTRRTFNGTIPEPIASTAESVKALVEHIDGLEREILRQQRINRMLCKVIEDQAIKVTLKGVEGC